MMSSIFYCIGLLAIIASIVHYCALVTIYIGLIRRSFGCEVVGYIFSESLRMGWRPRPKAGVRNLNPTKTVEPFELMSTHGGTPLNSVL